MNKTEYQNIVDKLHTLDDCKLAYRHMINNKNKLINYEKLEKMILTKWEEIIINNCNIKNDTTVLFSERQ